MLKTAAAEAAATTATIIISVIIIIKGYAHTLTHSHTDGQSDTNLTRLWAKTD